MFPQSIRIGVAANEDSGDQLGAALLRALRGYTDASVEVAGMGGPLLEREGCRLLVSMDQVRSFRPESFSSLRRMLALRKWLTGYFLEHRPDVFIGLDAPDFNLPLARRLRANGIRTIQYVGPSVWYWRPGRVRKVAQAVDAILLLFPFEQAYYRQARVRAVVTGHPLADELAPGDTAATRRKLRLAVDTPVLGLMMGSRDRELYALTEDFLRTAAVCRRHIPDLQCVASLLSEKQMDFVRRMRDTVCPELPLTVLRDQTIDAMNASDALLLCSGTVTLEAMLLARPMVAAYRLPRLLCYLYLCFLPLSWPLCLPPFSLPNIIAGRRLVPEFVQRRVHPSYLAPPLLKLLSSPETATAQRDAFIRLRTSLPSQAADRAARAVLRELTLRSADAGQTDRTTSGCL